MALSRGRGPHYGFHLCVAVQTQLAQNLQPWALASRRLVLTRDFIESLIDCSGQMWLFTRTPSEFIVKEWRDLGKWTSYGNGLITSPMGSDVKWQKGELAIEVLSTRLRRNPPYIVWNNICSNDLIYLLQMLVNSPEKWMIILHVCFCWSVAFIKKHKFV